MIKMTTRIVNKLGMHARPAAMLVTAAAKFKAEVYLAKGDFRVNGKSIMGVMMLAAEKGTEIVVDCDGLDEEEAATEIVRIIESGFGEEI